MEKDIKNIVSKDFEVGSIEDPITKLISKFEGSRDVIILNDDQGYKGVITEKQLTRTLMDISKTKAKKLMRNAPKISMKTSFAQAVRLMVQSNLFHLPVFENDKVIGVIKSSDLLDAIVDEISHLEAKNIMTKGIITLHPKSPLKKALVMFREEGISRIVVKDDKLLGVISLHDVVTKALRPTERPGFGRTFDTNNALDVPVESLMRKEVIKAGERATPGQIFDLMKNHDVSSVLIEEKGVITRKDLLEALSYELNKEEEEVFIQLSTKIEDLNKEGVVQEVADFVEKNKSIGPGYIYIHIHKHKETHRNKPLIHVRLRVRCKNSYDVTSEGYGEDHAIREGLRKLKTLILKSEKSYKAHEVLDYFDLDAH